MSRPFPDTFDDARSPPTPLAGGPSSSISYQANVNRRKTKKWADAKPVSYGGDDWGDEYEEEYEAAPPQPPAPRATGFRQPGQEARAFAPPAGMPTYADGKKSYGDLPSLPKDNYDRSATLPSQMHRKNSFDNDERRTFSTGPSRITQDIYTQHRGQPSLHISTPSQTGLRKAVAPPAETPTPPVDAPGAFPATPCSTYSTSDARSYMGEQAQHPYQQPQANPLPPVEARPLPPQADAPPYERGVSPGFPGGRSCTPSAFPPRKASLGQVQDFAGMRLGSRDASQERATRPWLGPTSPEGSAAPAQAPATKALPFIRPADIYKRLEEERTRERQSMESGRPSMDSLMGMQDREPLGQPVGQAQHGHLAQPMGRGRSGSSSQDYTDSGHRQGASLEPVPERRSEYSFMNTSTVPPDAAQQLRELRELEREESPSKQQYQPFRRRSPSQPAGPSPTFIAPLQAAPEAPQKEHLFQEERDSFNSAADGTRFSVSPKLPDLNRFSGFGFDSWTSPSETTNAGPVTVPAHPGASVETQKPVDEPLRRKVSEGFTSVVHQAFDREDSFSADRSGDIRRTDSESNGATGISPIISRGTAATFCAVHDNTTPATMEEGEPNSRGDSGNNITKQMRPATPEQQTPFHLGHRRDLSAPSAGNSPARTPVVARSEKSYQEEEAQITQETDSSPNTATPAESRPVADRMESFGRPHIPGGWQSYATTATVDPTVEEEAPRLNASPQPAESPLPTPHEDRSDFANTADIAPNTAEIMAGDEEAALRLNASPQPESQVPTPHKDRSGFVDTADIAVSTGNIMASTRRPDGFSPEIAAKTDELAPPSPRPEHSDVVKAPGADEHSPYVAKQMDNLAMPSPGLDEKKGTAPDEFDPSLARQMDNVALPTPDPAMAPIGNPYSTAALDPRLDDSTYGIRATSPDAPKSAETITGLAPPIINEPGVSPGSSVGPTPPPKDTPNVGSFGGGEYFPPPVPLKPKTAEEVAAQEGLAPPSRPAMLPTLSTNTAPYDDENDKLRKEIVKSLSPRVSLSGQSGAPEDHNRGQSMLGVSSGQSRESMYLPSEYGDYWGSTEDDSHNQSQIDAPLATAPAVPSDYNVNVTAGSPNSGEAATPPIPPLNPKRMSRTSQDMPRTLIDSRPSGPGFLETRYSWEQEQEKVKQDERGITAAAAAVHIPDSREMSPDVDLNGKAAGRLPTNTLSRMDSASPAPLSIRSAQVSEPSPAPQTEEPQGVLGRAAAVGAAAIAGVAATAAAVLPSSPTSDEKQVVSAEKNVPQLGSVVVDDDPRINDKALCAEVSPFSAGPVDQIPTILNASPPPDASVHHYTPTTAPIPGQERDSLQDMKPSPLNVSRPATAQSANTSLRSYGPRPLNPAQAAAPRAFREIMSLPTPEQRICAYNEARSQYATMENGLAHWLAVQTGIGANIPSAQQFSGVTGGEHSRQGIVATSGGADGGGMGPQPYYQQYLNASSNPTTPGGAPSRLSTHGLGVGHGLSGTQGFGNGSKSQQARDQAERATEQAKAKSKEFLHSAGVFGGKSVKAGKGLLMKGKSRWLGGGDKGNQRSVSSPLASRQRQSYEASRPPIEAPKNRRRTSWIPHLVRPASRGMVEAEVPPSIDQTASHSSSFGQQEHRYLPGSWRHRPPSNPSNLQQEVLRGEVQEQPRPSFQHELSGQKTPQEMVMGLATPPQVPQQQGQLQYARSLAGQQASQEVQQLCGQRKNSLPLPLGVNIHERELSSNPSSSISTTQPAQPPVLELNLPRSSLRDDRWMGSPSASTASVATRASLDSPLPKLPTEKPTPELPLPDLPWDTKRVAGDTGTEEENDKLGQPGPPKPIGKFQPSWDPFNATPIAEEDGFGWGSGGSGDSRRGKGSKGSGSTVGPRGSAPTARPLSQALSRGSSDETTKGLGASSKGEEGKSILREREEDWVVVSPDDIDSPESADSGAQDFLKGLAQGALSAKHDRGMIEGSEVSALTVQPESEEAPTTTFQEDRGATNPRNDDIVVTAEEAVLTPARERVQMSPLGQVMADEPHPAQPLFQDSSLGESIDLAHQPATISRSGKDDYIQQTPDANQFLSQPPHEQSSPEDTEALTPLPPQFPSHDSSSGDDVPPAAAELSRSIPGSFPDVPTPGTVGTVEKEKEIEDSCESYFTASPELSPQNQSLASSARSLAPTKLGEPNHLVETEIGESEDDRETKEERRQNSWEAGDNRDEPRERSSVPVDLLRSDILQEDRSLSLSPLESIYHYTVSHGGEFIRTPAAEHFTTPEPVEDERWLIPVELAKPLLEQEGRSLAPTELRESCISSIEKEKLSSAPADTESPVLGREEPRDLVLEEIRRHGDSQDEERRYFLVPSELANQTLVGQKSRNLAPEGMREQSRLITQTEDMSRPSETVVLARYVDEQVMAEPKQRQTSLRLASQSPQSPQTSSLVPVELPKGTLQEQPRSIVPDELQQDVHREQEQTHSRALAELQRANEPRYLLLGDLGQQQQPPANDLKQDVATTRTLSPTELSIPPRAEEYRSLVPEEMNTPESRQEAYDEPTRTQMASNKSYPQQRDQVIVSETAAEEPGPRRTSPFGLSHIRQGSFGFGRTISKATRAKERFSIEDDEGSVHSPQVTSPTSTTEPSKSIREVSSMQSQETTTTPSRQTTAADNRFSFQPSPGGPIDVGKQRVMLSRLPMMQQGSSDYNTFRTGTSTPTPTGAYPSQNQSLVDTPIMTSANGSRPNSILMEQPRQQVRQPMMPGQLPAQGRREFSSETPRQSQQRPPPFVPSESFEQEQTKSQQMPGSFGAPSSDYQPSQLTRRRSEVLPARYAAGAGTNFPQSRMPSREQDSLERNAIVRRQSVENQRPSIDQTPPSMTMAPQTASPLKIATQFTEAISRRQQSFIRTGAREGLPGIPPSSAQRYPELFQSTQPVDNQHEPTSPQSRADSSQLAQEVKDDGEHLPGEYPTVEKGYLPRQQATEYALPGVGPPADEEKEKERNGRHSKRGPGIFKEISGRLSSVASRERTSRQVSREPRPLSKQRPVVAGIDAGERVERRDSGMTVENKKDEKKDREHNRTKSLLAMVNPFGGGSATSENERPNSKAESMVTDVNQPSMAQQPGSQFPPQGPQQAASQQQRLPPPQPGYQQFQAGPQYEVHRRPIQPVHQQTAQRLSQAPPPGFQQPQQHQRSNPTTRNMLQKRSSTASKHGSMAFPAAASPSPQTQRPPSTAFPSGPGFSAGATAPPSPQKKDRKSFFGGLFGKKRSSGVVEDNDRDNKKLEKKPPLAAVLGAVAVGAQHAPQQQMMFQQHHHQGQGHAQAQTYPAQMGSHQQQQQYMNQASPQGRPMGSAVGTPQPLPYQQFANAQAALAQQHEFGRGVSPQGVPPTSPGYFPQQGPPYPLEQMRMQQGQPPQMMGGLQNQPQGLMQIQQHRRSSYNGPPLPGPYQQVGAEGQTTGMGCGLPISPQQGRPMQQQRHFHTAPREAFPNQMAYEEYMGRQQMGFEQGPRQPPLQSPQGREQIREYYAPVQSSSQAPFQNQGQRYSGPPARVVAPVAVAAGSPAVAASTYQSQPRPQQKHQPSPFDSQRQSGEYIRELNRRESGEYARSRSHSQSLAQPPPVPTQPRGRGQRREQETVHPHLHLANPDPSTSTLALASEQQITQQIQLQQQQPIMPCAFPQLPPNQSSSASSSSPDRKARKAVPGPFLGQHTDIPRRLSQEVLVARSPARAQFGQQAPYQLSLPGGDDEDEEEEEEEERRVMDRRRSPLHQQQFPTAVPLSGGAMRGGDERVDDRAERPSPPFAKWSSPPTPTSILHNRQGSGASQPHLTPNSGTGVGVNRSNTILSDVSALTADSNGRRESHPVSRSPPTNPASPDQSHGHSRHPSAMDSASPRSSAHQTPHATPVVKQAETLRPAVVRNHKSEPLVERIHISRTPDNRTPEPSPPIAAPVAGPVQSHLPLNSDPPRQPLAEFQIERTGSPSEPKNGLQVPDHEGLIYDNSREGLIVVEDATVRRLRAGGPRDEEEEAVMSATSFPGDEWRPWEYESYDEAGYNGRERY